MDKVPSTPAGSWVDRRNRKAPVKAEASKSGTKCQRLSCMLGDQSQKRVINREKKKALGVVYQGKLSFSSYSICFLSCGGIRGYGIESFPST